MGLQVNPIMSTLSPLSVGCSHVKVSSLNACVGLRPMDPVSRSSRNALYAERLLCNPGLLTRAAADFASKVCLPQTIGNHAKSSFSTIITCNHSAMLFEGLGSSTATFALLLQEALGGLRESLLRHCAWWSEQPFWWWTPSSCMLNHRCRWHLKFQKVAETLAKCKFWIQNVSKTRILIGQFVWTSSF